MIERPAFPVEEWSVREREFHLNTLAQTESIFALSNGHIGLRGNLDEGEPHGLPGTYLNSFYELRPLPYAEGGYAYPESGQTAINVTNGKLIRLLVDDEPFDVRYGGIHGHERELDFRNGLLRRSVRWTTPAGRTVKVSSVRMVSFTQRAIVAISYEVEPLETPVRVVVQSELVAAALSAARLTGWKGLLAEQRAYLDDFWSRADVELEGDPEIQQAVRFALFHVLQAGARGEGRPIPAKGLTGPGYDGHTFWDMEIFVLPVLTMTLPRAAADVLRWRHLILDKARDYARQYGLSGAAFPWRTIRGAESSGYWPAGTAAFHINADVAYAVANYIVATGDTAFEEEVGLELLVETARLWYCLGFFNATGQFRIDGVTGPDEYSALADNNVYTNLMAQRNLHWAAEGVKRFPEKARALGVEAEEAAGWREAAEKMFIPYDERLGVTPQDEDFTKHAVWDFAHTAPDQYPLLLHFTYFDLYRKQVVKQADLVLAMHLRSDAFTQEQKARNFAYYEPLTVRDSSLSASTQAVIAAEVGQLQLAYDYLGEAALVDLHDLHHNVRDGLHIASLAGAWTALVAGFGGLRLQKGSLWFSPRLPEELQRLAFHLLFRGCRLRVEVTATEATYRLLEGSPLKVRHHGEEILMSMDGPVTRSIPPVKAGPRPTQPPGREPLPRGARAKSTSSGSLQSET